jgi:HEPN domain-containing protein
MLSTLVKTLERHGYGELAVGVATFVDESKRVLVELEEAYTAGRYGYTSYSKEDAERAVRTVRRLVELLDGVVRDVKLG